MSDIRHYAKELLASAIEQDALSEVKADSQSILKLESNQDFKNFLANPTIQPHIKAQMFQQLFEGKIHPLTLNFLFMLAEKQSEGVLLRILAEFIRKVNEQVGIVTAHVKTAVAISDSQKEHLRQKLSVYSDKTVNIETEIDPSIKGGFIARIEDTVFDGSLVTQLNKLGERLASGEGV